MSCSAPDHEGQVRRHGHGSANAGDERARPFPARSALLPLEANFALPLVHEIASENDWALLDIAVAAEINLVGDAALAAADAAREAGNSPNTVMAAAAALIGPKRVERALPAQSGSSTCSRIPGGSILMTRAWTSA